MITSVDTRGLGYGWPCLVFYLAQDVGQGRFLQDLNDRVVLRGIQHDGKRWSTERPEGRGSSSLAETCTVFRYFANRYFGGRV